VPAHQSLASSAGKSSSSERNSHRLLQSWSHEYMCAYHETRAEAAAHASYELCLSHQAYHDSKKSPKNLPGAHCPLAHTVPRIPAPIHRRECVNMNRADQGRAEVGAKTVCEVVVPLCSTADRRRAPTSDSRPGHWKSYGTKTSGAISFRNQRLYGRAYLQDTTVNELNFHFTRTMDFALRTVVPSSCEQC
jgi:hypothetical protein